jgi:hypothetical protein
VGKAIIWTILGAYLLLPVGADIKFEGVPALDKNSIPSLMVFAGCLFAVGRFPRLSYGVGTVELLCCAFVVSPFITSNFNGDELRFGGLVLPGVGTYDALSAAASQFIVLLPFFLGRQFLRSASDNEDILRILALAGFAYSLPMLFELRMSPQLHVWTYGYFPHSFEQQMRDGGFRPVVFLGHGLLVAFFGMTAAVAAAALWRTKVPLARLPASLVTGYLSGVMVLCKTLGTIVYGAVLVPLVRFASPRLQLRLAVVLVTIALAYPMLRTIDLVPTQLFLDAAGSVSSDRARSLGVRFDQEYALLERASERRWFGWGRWGRNRVYDEAGRDVSVTDGRWIITMGTFGVLGFIAEFGLLALPVFRAASALRFATSTPEKILLAALALIVAINVFDLLPNSSIRPWTWLLTGALLGRTEALRAGVKRGVALGGDRTMMGVGHQS